jgi:hypothetical protein
MVYLFVAPATAYGAGKYASPALFDTFLSLSFNRNRGKASSLTLVSKPSKAAWSATHTSPGL